MRVLFLMTLLGLFVWHTPEPQRTAAPNAPATDLNLAVQTGHTAMIWCLAFSPDGEILASGGRDQTVVLWKVATGRQIRVLRGHFGNVRSVGFSADGKRIASTGSGRDRSIKLWSVETGELLKTFAIEHDILSISFSHDGLYLAGFDDELGLIFLWDAATGRELHPLLDHRASAIAFSPVEPLLASADKYSDTISLLDPRTAKVVRVLRGHEGHVYALQFGRDGKALVSGGEDGTVRRWVVGTGKPQGILNGYPNQITAVSLTKSGGTALSLGEDGLVRAGDFNTGKVIGLNAAGFEARMGTFSTGGDTLATREELENVVLWDRAGGAMRTLKGNRGEVTDISYNPSGNSIATSDGNRAVTIWSLKARGGPRLLAAGKAPDSLAAKAAGAALSDSLAVEKWEHQGSVTFNPGGNLVASAERGGAVHVWNVNSGEEVSTAACPTCYSFAFAAKGNVLALDPFPDVANSFSTYSMGGGGRKLANPPVKVWDVSACKNHPCPSAFRELRTSITRNMSVSGDGKTVAALGPSYNIPMVSFGFSPGTVSDIPFEYTWTEVSYPVRIFDVGTGQSLRTFAGKTFGLVTPDGVLAGRATSLAYNPKRNVLASGGGLFDKGHIELWNPATGELLRTLKEVAKVNSLAFEPAGGTILASATDDPNITLWDVNSYAPAGVFRGHSDAVLSVAFSSDGRFLFSGSKDNTVKIWDVTGRKELASITMLGRTNWMVVTPDGLFDTSSLEENQSANWVMRDDPLNPLPIEIFMRDYYQPNLLPRILRGQELPQLPSPLELNRVQPKVGGVKVLRREGDAEFVDVSVEVTSVPGQCMREGRRVPCESGVYDLRLYRDGHLVARSPAPDLGAPAGAHAAQGRQARLQEWRRSSEVKTEDGRAVKAASGRQTVTFKRIRLPLRAEAPGVEFTAYAFNEDRVKSATSEPAVYQLSGTRPGGRPRAYVVAVGVDVTSDPNWRLSFAPNGARDVARLLEEKLASRYEVVSVPLISEYREDAPPDQHPASKHDIKNVLSLLSSYGVSEQQRRELPALAPATPDDLVVMYVASHGYADPSGKFYVIPSDIGEPAGVSEELLDRCLRNSEQSGSCEAAREFLRRSISSDELTQWLQGIDAGQMVLILDSCHSGAVSGPDFKPGPMGDRGFGQLSYDKGMLVLAATQAENVAWGALELENRSLLTYALTKQQTPAQPFNFRQWLSRAENLVPDLYRSNLNEKQQQQEPTLFDFARRRVARADGAP